MSYRYMRIILFYDLPAVTNTDKRVYRKFHVFLEREGFIQMQESIYTKLVLNNIVAKSVVSRVKEKSPSKGVIQILTITEKQFSQIEYIIGSKQTNHIDSEERLIIL